MLPNDLSCREHAPVAGPDARAGDFESGIEDVRQFGGIDASAAIPDLDFDGTVARPRRNANLAAAVQRLNGILQQVAEHRA